MPSLKNASNKANAKKKKADYANFLSGLGKSKIEFDKDAILDAIEGSIGEFITRVINNIDKAVGSTGEPLINTGDITNISAEKTENGWRIVAPPQLDFQSKGISGTERSVPNSPYKFSGSKKAVNLDSVRLWVRQRGIKYEGMTEEQTVFLISRSIYKKGIDPKNLWEGEVSKLQEDIGKEIANQIAASFSNNSIKKDIKINDI